MSLALAFPTMDPVAISLGPLAIRWYALAYLAGLLLGAWLAGLLLRRSELWPGAAPPMAPERVFDAMGWIAIGVIVGGRLGFTLFYAPGYYLAHPLEILAIWKGGMSFHGGMLGAGAAAFLYAGGPDSSRLGMGDLLGCVAPVGLLFGRIANFVNGELWGRASDVPWAVVFPSPAAGGVPRHPSQLYEAALEGALLLGVMLLLAYRFRALRRPGTCCGVFLLGYGVARIFVEQFREPDSSLGFLVALGGGGVTMGMILSAPMVIAGAWLIARAQRSARRS